MTSKIAAIHARYLRHKELCYKIHVYLLESNGTLNDPRDVNLSIYLYLYLYLSRNRSVFYCFFSYFLTVFHYLL